VQILNTQKRFKICRPAIAGLCRAVLHALDVGEASLSVVFVNSARMKELNGRYRKRDYATDVLSFEYRGEEVEGRAFLGEIVIAPEIAWRQSHRWRGKPDREIRKLIVHGILHLLGYDHEADQGEMNRLQERLLRKPNLGGDPERPLVEMRDIG
jgi:probable rRNA maturation factor